MKPYLINMQNYQYSHQNSYVCSRWMLIPDITRLSKKYSCCLSLNESCLCFALAGVLLALSQVACWVSWSVPLWCVSDNTIAVQWHWQAVMAPPNQSSRGPDHPVNMCDVCARAQHEGLALELVSSNIVKPFSFPNIMGRALAHPFASAMVT